MASLNKVMLIGNAGRDAELRYMANGTAQASFSLAVNRNLRGPDGEWTQETDWFNVVAWRDLAERLSQTVTKGRQLYVEGRLQIRSWDNDQGVKQYRTEVVANQVLRSGAVMAATAAVEAAAAVAAGKKAAVVAAVRPGAAAAATLATAPSTRTIYPSNSTCARREPGSPAR